MAQTFAKMLPFIIAGMMVPSWTKYVIILLASGRPMVNSLAFILGNAVWRLILGVASIYFFSLKPVKETIDNPPGQESLYLLIPAIVLIVLGIYLFRKQPLQTDGELPGWLKALDRVKPWMAFFFGFATVAAPGIQYVYFLGGTGVLGSAQLAVPETTILLLVMIVMMELMLLTPVLIFKLGGTRAEEWMGDFKDWLGRNEFKVFAVIFFFIGLFLLAKGIGVL